MRSFFVLVALGLFLLAASGAALVWDGSYYLFQTLNTQTIAVQSHRLVSIPLQWPALLLSLSNNDISTISMVFGLGYAVVPLFSLAAAWLLVRDSASPLFIWAALAIGLGTLPGQIFLVSEADIAVQLAWPIFLALLSPPDRWKWPVIALLALAIFFAHPFSIPIFAIAASLAFLHGWRNRDQRRVKWGASIFFALLCGIATVRFSLLSNTYETEQISTGNLIDHFISAVAGFPLVALICAWLSGALLVLDSVVIERKRLRPVIFGSAIAAIILAGCILVYWAASPRRWAGAIDYRTWVLFCTLPFILLLALEATIRGGAHISRESMLWNRRIHVVRLIGLMFLLVLSFQALAWTKMIGRARATIKYSEEPCIARSSIIGRYNAPLQHWSVGVLSIMLQGRVPEKVVLPGSACHKSDFVKGIALTAWDPPARGTGWFDLHPLLRHLAALPPSPQTAADQADSELDGSKPTAVAPTATPHPTPGVAPKPLATPTPGVYARRVLGTTGLVSYWRLDEGAGKTVIDSTGHHPAELRAGVTLGSAGALVGDRDTAITFDGSSASIKAPDDAKLNIVGDLSIEAWVRPGIVDSSSRAILGKGTGDTAFTRQYRLGMTASPGGSPHWRASIYVADTAYVVDSDTVPVSGTWQYLVLVRRDNTLTIYVNGVAENAGTISSDGTNITTGALTIGRMASSNDPQVFAGTIDEVAVYDVALRADQVQAHYAAASRVPEAVMSASAVRATPTDTPQASNDVH